jgi:hypothetical protein
VAPTVDDLLDPFLAVHGYSRQGYHARGFVLTLGPLRLPMPNPGRLHLHDLHHIGLGAEQDFWGEVEVSVFELRGGAPTAYITALCISGIALGALRAPRRVWRWWCAYAGVQTLYPEPDYPALLRLSRADLRARMRLATP